MSLTSFHITQGYILTVPMNLSAQLVYFLVRCYSIGAVFVVVCLFVLFFFLFFPPRLFLWSQRPVNPENQSYWTEVRKALTTCFFFASFIASSLVQFSSSPMFSLPFVLLMPTLSLTTWVSAPAGHQVFQPYSCML